MTPERRIELLTKAVGVYRLAGQSLEKEIEELALATDCLYEGCQGVVDRKPNIKLIEKGMAMVDVFTDHYATMHPSVVGIKEATDG